MLGKFCFKVMIRVIGDGWGSVGGCLFFLFGFWVLCAFGCLRCLLGL